MKYELDFDDGRGNRTSYEGDDPKKLVDLLMYLFHDPDLDHVHVRITETAYRDDGGTKEADLVLLHDLERR